MINKFREVAIELNTAIFNLAAQSNEGKGGEKQGSIDATNICLMKLSRILDPVNYTLAGRYGHDKWGDLPKPIPGLQKIGELTSMDQLGVNIPL